MKVISVKEEQFWIIKDNMNKHKFIKYHDYIEFLLKFDKGMNKNNTTKFENCSIYEKMSEVDEVDDD